MIDESGVAMSIAIYINNNLIQTSSNAIEANVWHHVAFTYDKDAGSGTCLIYIDGVLVYSDTSAGGGNTIGTNDHSLVIGADESTTTQGWGGYIAQVGLWERVLTQEEIQSVKEKTYSELTTTEKGSILCYYGLDSVYQGEWNPHASGSGMIVDDKAGTESLGTELATSLTWIQNPGNEFETFSSSGNQIIQASNTTGHGICQTSTFSLEANAFYKLSFNLGYTADDADNDTINVVCIGNGNALGLAPRPFQLTNWSTTGSQTYYFKATSSLSTYSFGFQTGNNKVLTITLSDLSIKKVTGKNFGTLE